MLLLGGAALLQSSVLPRLFLGGLTPDLILLLVVSWSLIRGLSQGVALAFAGGMVLDLISGGPLGGMTLALVLSSAVTSIAQAGMARDSLWLPLVGGALATVCYDGVYTAVLQLAGHSLPLRTALQQVIIPSLFWNTLLMYPMCSLLRRLHLRTVPGQAT